MEYPYLEGLSESQYSAVTHIEGPSLVVAGAGSGKTRVLTYRIAHLINQGNHPGSIMALTFTNKAAKEMKARISTVSGQENAQKLWMGTFHSIFARILRYEAETLGFPQAFTIYDTSDSKSLLRSICKEMKLDPKVYKVNTVLGRISSAKNNLVTAAAYKANQAAKDHDAAIRMPKISDIYEIYSRRCKVAGAMDFDDLLLYTNLLFHKYPEILEKYQDRFSYVLVDEYQDTNFSQYLIVKKLSEKKKNICVVGDDAQSIYSFRGARIENILNFRNDYPNYKEYKLEQNYRSTKNIVSAAGSIIAKNKNQIPKEVFSENEDGEKVKLIQARTDSEEGILVVNAIMDNRNLEHDQFEDYAILYRTNAQSRVIEESLRKQNLPYKIYGGQSFYERTEIKSTLSYLRLLINPLDNEALKRVINYPARGIGGTTLMRLEASSSAYDLPIWEIIEKHEEYDTGIKAGTWKKIDAFKGLIEDMQIPVASESAYEVALNVTKQAQILSELYKDKTPENLSRYENVQELLNAIQEFTINATEAGQPATLEQYLQDVALITDLDSEKPEDKNTITLMTIHSAKGLEFKNVFIVGVEEKLFPSNFGGTISTESLEEERRLFYVALTRAEKKCWVSYAQQRYNFGKLDMTEPSRFIDEIDRKYVSMPQAMDAWKFRKVKPNKETGGYARKKPAQPVQKQINPLLARKLSSMKAATVQAKEEINPASKDDLSVGVMVEHQRFGIGKILQIEHDKVVVNFENHGRKQLLLKFARLTLAQ